MPPKWGRPFAPVIDHDGLTHRLRPSPDKTLIIGDTHLIIEHDCGVETIEYGNIIRDAAIGRNNLVYDQLFMSGEFKKKQWRHVVVVS